MPKKLRITKVYTKTGDKGKTRLAGGQPVWKDDIRVEAYGAIDELNAAIGMSRATLLHEPACRSLETKLEPELRWVQHKLFDIGGLLATAPGQSFPNMPRVVGADVKRLEELIDRCQADLAPLKEFILPGGGLLATSFHLSRTVCRRAERRCVQLSRKQTVDPTIVAFLNRLSDAFFVLARWVSHRLGEQELLWERCPSAQ